MHMKTYNRHDPITPSKKTVLHPVFARERASGSDLFEADNNNNNNNKALEVKIFFNSRKNQDTCRRAVNFCNSDAL